MENGYTILNKTNAGDALPLLEAAEESMGFIPNIIGIMANAPTLVESYLSMMAIFEKTSFNGIEKQVIALVGSATNKCPYCVAAHSTVAAKQRVPNDVIGALRNGTPIPDIKLEALRKFTMKMVENQGWMSERGLKEFIDAGYNKQHVLEVVVGVSMKMLSNYTNHITDTLLDADFSEQAWSAE